MSDSRPAVLGCRPALIAEKKRVTSAVSIYRVDAVDRIISLRYMRSNQGLRVCAYRMGLKTPIAMETDIDNVLTQTEQHHDSSK